jgi:poly-gamma-glutamate synthesis protein (capsule biosynthesis protein)
VRAGLLVVFACGGSESISQPAATPTRVTITAQPCAEWRYAVVTESFDPVENLTRDELITAWTSGDIAASQATITALGSQLGVAKRVPRVEERPEPTRSQRAIVPVHELSPAWKVVTIDGVHPLDPAHASLSARACHERAGNFDPAKLTTVVMSGTTALTRRTAERIDSHGAADLVEHIAPWFRSADVTHVSNEVAFIRDCDPLNGLVGGDKDLTFCSKDSYIEVLDRIGTDIVELTGSHLSDYGGLARTVEIYRKRGWAWFGGGRTQLESTEPRILEHHGHRLAFLGCNAVGTWLHAVSTGAGVAACDWSRMTWQIRDLRARGYLPIVSIQHQETHEHDVPPGLVVDLRRLAEAGAIFVLGSQAHSAHPWDVHHGAFVHYGPGNILFAQSPEAQREASVDKLYIHAGKLLTVEHLYTRTEHGQPRQLTARERARFLGQLEEVSRAYPPSDPWKATAPADLDARMRPDSMIVQHGRMQQLAIRVPERLDGAKRYPLVVDLEGAATHDDAFVVSPVGKLRATGDEIATFMRAKYPVDPARTQITPAPKRSKRR